MKTNNMKKVIYILSLALISVGCSKFVDVNDNPNNPPISTPSLTLPVAQQDFAALNARTLTYLGNFLAVNWATPSNWQANAIFSRYDFTSQDFANVFETSYADIFKNLTYIENYEDPSGAVDYTNYKAISTIIKGFQYQLLVDLYGDVPFTEANLRGENTTPAYDDGETIYKTVIDNLTDVVDMINDAPANAENPGGQDIIFGGDMDHWVEFANTIKLRMLVRMSNTGQDSYITSQVGLINANGGGYIMDDVASNPGYTSDENKQNPFWDYFRKPATGDEQNRGDFTVATTTAISFLQNNADPRLSRLYAPSRTGSAFKGTVQSTALPGTGFTSNDLAKVGPGLLKSANQDQIIMSLAEALFIQAEAAQRGYITGDAKDFYEMGVEASFVQLGVEDAVEEAEIYYTQPIKNVSWDASPNKIEAIITQKWVALNGTSSIESWIDLTRTGFPLGLPIPAESAGSRPVRLLYPASEVSRNTANVPKLTAADVFTKAPFWK
ncbi:SusD/RagB family nutrient-binding outer membrane lipoprotein [Gelidibacter salicanalis]|uniref:SusD/RagB family nutrient-binding outer membrane lipoprotein n=2 Tax=Gelidibacter salicanalis TaxID=291193 RepID=A0A5C7AET4_9FLAO|nr:SusD/RagB family nutrient-binding outer membrane lipoprotein [Gelidibacter salicanalis]